MSINIQSLHKQFGTFSALNNVSLEIQTGEFVALLGPSGSGKTTLLRTIAGLETPNAGQLFFHDRDVTETSAKDRGTGFIFQHYALFRHMTVYENIAFGLTVLPKEKRPSNEVISKKVSELLELIQLSWLKDKFPAQLSGGQKQRVALARALAVEPKVLLLDEPFGALDTNIRKELRNWLRNLHDRLNMTSVFVTHDVEEALEVADKVVIMNEGKIIQVDTPENIFHKPANAFVYKFIGDVNLYQARKNNGEAFQTMIRPSDISIHLEEITNLDTFKVTIQSIKHVGQAVRITLIDASGQILETRVSTEDKIATKLYMGMHVYAAIDSKKMFHTDYQI